MINQLFAPAPVQRRSPLAVAFSALLHVAAAIATLWVADLGAFEPPSPRSASVTFVLVRAAVPEPPPLRQPRVMAVSEPVLNTRAIDAPRPAEQPAPATVAPIERAEAVDAPDVELPPPAVVVTRTPSVEPPPPAAPLVSVGAFGAAPRLAQSRDRAAGVVRGAQLQTARPPIGTPVPDAGAVRAAEFDRRVAVPAAAAPEVPRAPDRPVEVVFKPSPDYTDEARALGIQGDVILDVEFSAAGEVRVLRVVRGLGHGLDEAAARAAARIRFTPARRAGRPVDVRTVVHIVFRLA